MKTTAEEKAFRIADAAYEAALKEGNYRKSNAAYIARSEALERLTNSGRVNYRIEARQQNLVVSGDNLPNVWDSLGLPLGKCPSIEAIAAEAEKGEPWYLFTGSTGEYIYVSKTKQSAHPTNVVFNKYGHL